jgi:quercetin dioxygenase-like cupin family protein
MDHATQAMHPAPETVHFAGSRLRILVPGETADGVFSLIEVTKPAGSRTPPHLHADEDEAVYVLDGELTVEAGGHTVTLAAGGVATLPREAAHRLSNAGAGAARYLLLCTPAGFDAYARDAGIAATDPLAPAAPPTEPDIARMRALAPDFNITMLTEADLAAPGAPPVQMAPERLTGPSDLDAVRVEVVGETGVAETDPCLTRAAMPPGSFVGLHAHGHREVIYVAAGRLEVALAPRGADDWRVLEAGEAVNIAPDVPHALRNVSDATATAVMVWDRRAVQFFRDMAADVAGTPPGSQAAAARMAQQAATEARYGYRVGSAEENAAIGLRLGGPSE